MRIPLAIVGNGAAAAEAIVALRTHGYEGDIHLFADNQHAPYNPMLGTYLVSGAIAPERVFPFGDERTFYGANRVTAHLGQAVTALDAVEQTLGTVDGSSYTYDRCLLASGARAAIPPVPGLEEARQSGTSVFPLRSLDDALRLKEAADDLRRRPGDPARVAVIGASFVGVKIAAVLHEMGMRACLVEREPHILPLSSHPDCAHPMQADLRAQGYDLRLGAVINSVDSSRPTSSGRGRVRLDLNSPMDGASFIDADLVVLCTGSRPTLDFLTPGAVDMEQGVLVDEQMCSSVPTLLAAGDVAQGKNLVTGRHEIVGLWASARHQGRAAGRSLAGVSSGYPGGVPHNITHVGRMLFASIGCLRDYDRVTTCSDGDSLQVRVWQDERLVGVNLLGCCLSAGAVKQALVKAATGVVSETEATWTSFSA